MQRGIAGALAVIILLCGIIFVSRVAMGDAFNKEEAQHAVYGLWLAKDLRALDWGGFWYDTQRQMFWPFLHSWILSIFFTLFGINYFSARFLSFLLFLAALYYTYRIGERISHKNGQKIGLLAVGLALISPMMVRFAGENTLEGLGAVIFLSSFAFYSACEERKLTIDYVFLALLVGLSLYTSYLYAYLMIPAFIVMTLGKLGPIMVEVKGLSKKGEKAAVPFFWWAYRKAVFLTVLLIVAAAWFFTSTFSRKILLFLQAIFRYAGGENIPGFWPNLLYYFRAIIEQYTFSPWLGLLILASIFLPLIALHNRVLGKLYTFIWTVILLATLTVPTKAPQFIYIIAPFLYLVFAALVFHVWDKFQQYRNVLPYVIIIPALISLPRLTALYLPANPAENSISVLNYFKQTILPRHPVAAAINTQRLNPEGIYFHFWDWNAPVLADPIVGEEELLRNARYFLTVELEPGGKYMSDQIDDSLSRWNAFLQTRMQAGEIKEYSMRRFAALGLTAKIYEKPVSLEQSLKLGL